MSDSKNVDNPPRGERPEVSDTNITSAGDVSSVAGSAKTGKVCNKPDLRRCFFKAKTWPDLSKQCKVRAFQHIVITLCFQTHSRVSSSSERQIKFERAQKCLENAALVSKRIKEHRKATAELLGRPFGMI